MMKKLISKEELYDFLAIFFCVLNGYCRYSSLENRTLKKILATVFAVIGVGLLALKVIDKFRKKQFSEKQIKIALIVAAAAALVWYRPLEMYTAILVSLNYLDKDLRKLIKYIFIASVITYLLVIVLWLFGALRWFASHRNGEDIERLNMGFSQTNISFRFLLPIIFSGAIYFKNDKRYLIGVLFVALGLFIFTNSRAGFAVAVCFCLLSMLPKKIKLNLFKSEIIPYIFVFMIVVSVVSAVVLKNTIVNDLLTARLEIWNGYIGRVKILGGQKSIKEIGSLDNMFVGTLYYGGIYGLVFYMILYFVSFYKSNVKGNCSVALVFYMMFLYGFVENCTSLGESFIIVMVMVQLFDKKKLNELNEDYNEEVKLAD